VRVLGDRLAIEDLTINDPEASRVVRERAEAGEEPARTVRRAVEIGTRVLDREDTAIEVDYVRREFERLARSHSETVGRPTARRSTGSRRGCAARLGATRAPARWARPWRPTARSSPSRLHRPSARTARAPSRPRSSECSKSATRSSSAA
jgi:hypothetical protein